MHTANIDLFDVPIPQLRLIYCGLNTTFQEYGLYLIVILWFTDYNFVLTKSHSILTG